MTEATDPIALKWSRSGKNIRYGYSNVIAKAESVEYAALIVRSVNAAPGLAKALEGLTLTSAVARKYLRMPSLELENEYQESLSAAREALTLWEQ